MDLTVRTGNIRQQAFKLKAHNRGDYSDSSSPEWRLCWFISHTPRVVILTMRRDVLISTLFEGCIVKIYAEGWILYYITLRTSACTGICPYCQQTLSEMPFTKSSEEAGRPCS